jgi:osmotically-inducible protein OsmY
VKPKKFSLMKSEAEIQKDVMEELKWESAINAIKPAEIGVAVHSQVVTLTGKVDNYAVKMAAEKAALRVEGVKALANEIEVNISGINGRTDSELAEAALNALTWSTLVPEEKVKLLIEDGWLRLEGEVEWPFEKSAAEHAIENLMGVKGIDNLIVVKPVVPMPEDIRDKIKAAFKRHHFINGHNIQVDVKGKTAVLEGHVSSLAEKSAAENAAWSAPGISKVESKLEVDFKELFI